MRPSISIAAATAALILAGASRAANAAAYDITAHETSAFGPEVVSIQLDTSDAVASGGQTTFSEATVEINGAFQAGGVFTTNTNNIGGDGFYFIDTDTPNTKEFYTGSVTGTVFNSGTYTVADGATDGAGTLNIIGGPVSAAPEPSTWLLMIAGIGGIGLMLLRAKRTMGFRFKNAFCA